MCGLVSNMLVEWRAERDLCHPSSFQYRQLTEVLAELGDPEAAAMLEVPRLEHEDTDVPPGFITVDELDLAVVGARQFYKRVPGLYDPEAVYEAPAVELVADTGQHLRLVDLRPALNGRLSDIAPSADDQTRLDEHFLHDLVVFARTGQPRHTVGVTGRSSPAFYSRIIHTKLRAYFAPVSTKNLSGEGCRVVARIGDCGNDDGHEAALYRRLFGRTARLH